MKLTGILLAVGAYGAITLLGKKKDAAALKFSLANGSAELQGSTPVLNVTLAIQNPTNSSFSIRSFVGSISANGNTIGSIANYNQQNIAPLATSYYNIQVRMSLIGIAADIYNAINSGSGWQQSVTIDGTANVDGYLAPVKLTYTIGG